MTGDSVTDGGATDFRQLDQRIREAKAWLAQDPDEVTRRELGAIVDDALKGSAEAADELSSRFGSRLAFGTAGLRGEIGAGPNRMNRVLVGQAAAGFAAWLQARDERSLSIVIGYDGRTNSRVFARDTAEIFAGAGIRAVLLPRTLPTPVLAFAVRHLGASAGVMVTASHNPPRDNGYKVYLGDEDEGSQIVSPVDGEIAAHIDRIAAGVSVLELPRSDDYEIAAQEVVDAYVEQTAALIGTATATPRILYTAMHGVGWETVAAVFEAAGLQAPDVVTEQIEPDAAFPTVAFPNPEEPGALDLAYAAATRIGAGLIIANDPDADRLAIAIPSDTAETGWYRLTGNEIGLLLGWRAADRLSASGERGALAASLVSSPGLSVIADAYGLPYRDTLTGFKWVSRVPNLAYGFEEALGYLVDPAKVRDKDGISAAVELVGLVAELHAAGRTLGDQLDALAERFGAFASGQISIRVTDLADIGVITDRLRKQPPASLGGIAVESIDDFRLGVDGFPPSDILRYRLAGGSRVIVRPSGTEPKLKVYLDAQAGGATAAIARAEADAVVAALDAALRPLLTLG